MVIIKNKNKIMKYDFKGNLMDLLYELEFVEAKCNGNGTCLTCAVKIEENIPYSEKEKIKKSLLKDKRLSCQITTNDTITVII